MQVEPNQKSNRDLYQAWDDGGREQLEDGRDNQPEDSEDDGEGESEDG